MLETDEPVWAQGHMHSEPICAWPDCQTYLTSEQREPCGFVSPSSDDGYCRCVLPKHEGAPHRCIHGWLA